MNIKQGLVVAAALWLSGAAAAQGDYPNRPVRLITPFNPGGAIDIYSRLIAEPLQAALVAVDPATGEVTAMVGGRGDGEIISACL